MAFLSPQVARFVRSKVSAGAEPRNLGRPLFPPETGKRKWSYPGAAFLEVTGDVWCIQRAGSRAQGPSQAGRELTAFWEGTFCP